MSTTAPFGPPPVAVVGATAPSDAPHTSLPNDIASLGAPTNGTLLLDAEPQRLALAPPTPLDAAASVTDEPDFVASHGATSGLAGGRWIIAVAALATLSIVLQRNGIWRDLSRAVGMESTYLGIEKAVLGEPSIETPRGIERLLRETAQGDAPSAP